MSTIENVTEQQANVPAVEEVPVETPVETPVDDAYGHVSQPPVVKSENWFPRTVANVYVHYGVRAGQFVFTVLTLALTAASINYNTWNDSKTNYGLATAVMTLVYFIAGSGYANFAPASTVYVGVFLILEAVFTVFWFCAFVVLADVHGGRACNLSGSVNSYFFGNGYHNFVRSCKTGKAAVAMASIAWVLFVVSLVIYIFNVCLLYTSRCV